MKHIDVHSPQQMFEAMDKNPMGLLMNLQGEFVQANYWQRPKPEDKVFYSNFVGGLAVFVVKKKLVSKEELIQYITEILNTTEMKEEGK